MAAAAILKIEKSPYLGRAVQAISTKFGIVMQFYPLDRSEFLTVEKLKF